MTTETTTSPTLHVRYDGRSIPVNDFGDLDIGALSTDAEIKAIAAEKLDVPVSKFDNYQVDRHEGNFTLRPQAVFG